MDDEPTDEQTPSAEQTGDRWPLEGYFTCGSGFLVAPECLGTTFQTRTATYELTITLPRLDTPRAGAALARPAWRFNREGTSPAASADEEWGIIGATKRSDDGKTIPIYAQVFQCVIASSVEAQDKGEFQEAAGAVGKELAIWWDSVSDWLGVLTVQDFVRLGKRQQSILAEGFHAWSGDANGVRRAGITSVERTVGGGGVEVLEREQLQRAMTLAANGTQPPDEWLFIRDARSLLRAGEFRRAIIDAGSATELALTELLERRLSGVDPVIRATLMDRNRGLDRRAELTRALNAGTVPYIWEKLNRPRTRATHGNEPISPDQARDAIGVAMEIVEQAYPLIDLT